MSKAIGSGSETESKPAKVYDNGLTGLPLAQRPGIVLPTPANLLRVADEAAAKRNRTMSEATPQEFGQRFGIPRDFALFLQRLEARVIQLEEEVGTLRSTSALPPHMRDVERRG